MGYEVVFHFQEEVEKGIFSDEEKTKVIKVGTLNDDLPLDVVAGKIFAQLARRNIHIVDVEIFEFTKKKLSYKETEDGFIIKNKKFSFDDGVSTSIPEAALEAESSEAPKSNDLARLLDILAANPALTSVLRGEGNGQMSGVSSPLATPPQPPSPLSNLAAQRVSDRPLRHEIFDPPPWLLKEARKRSLKFTVGKKYPIFKEKIAENPSAGMIYTTVNDSGEKQSLSGIHFNPVPVKLEGSFVEGPMQEQMISRPNLNWDGVIDGNDMPSLR